MKLNRLKGWCWGALFGVMVSSHPVTGALALLQAPPIIFQSQTDGLFNPFEQTPYAQLISMDVILTGDVQPRYVVEFPAHGHRTVSNGRSELRFELHPTSNPILHLKSGKEAFRPDEVIEFSPSRVNAKYTQVQWTVVVPPGQYATPGTYLGTIEVNLYPGGRAARNDLDRTTLLGTILIPIQIIVPYVLVADPSAVIRSEGKEASGSDDMNLYLGATYTLAISSNYGRVALRLNRGVDGDQSVGLMDFDVDRPLERITVRQVTDGSPPGFTISD